MWASFLAVACVFCLFMSMIYQVNDMRLQRDRERARADEAINRLLAAWRDGYHIPEPAPEPFVEEPLPPALAEWLSQWEDPAARERFEADIRRKLAQGRTPDQLLMDLEVSS